MIFAISAFSTSLFNMFSDMCHAQSTNYSTSHIFSTNKSVFFAGAKLPIITILEEHTCNQENWEGLIEKLQNTLYSIWWIILNNLIIYSVHLQGIYKTQALLTVTVIGKEKMVLVKCIVGLYALSGNYWKKKSKRV